VPLVTKEGRENVPVKVKAKTQFAVTHLFFEKVVIPDEGGRYAARKKVWKVSGNSHTKFQAFFPIMRSCGEGLGTTIPAN